MKVFLILKEMIEFYSIPVEDVTPFSIMSSILAKAKSPSFPNKSMPS